MPMFKRQAAVLLALTALALGVIFYLWPDGAESGLKGRPIPMNGMAVQSSAEPAAMESRETQGSGSAAGRAGAMSASPVAGGKLIVFVSGEVKQPGVFELPAGSRIEDAVKAAGGFGVMADSQSLNLAQPVEDGAGLKVPRRSTVPQGDVGSMSGAVDGSIVRLNSATAVELETLPGIGPTLAGRIVDYRNRHGAFRRIEDIQEVPGIGTGRFERMKGRLAL